MAGWGGVLLTGLTTAAGIATDNEYLVGGGMSAARSYADSYEELNSSLIEEQRQSRLLELQDKRARNYAQFQRDLTAPDREHQQLMDREKLESEKAYRAGSLENQQKQIMATNRRADLAFAQWNADAPRREHETKLITDPEYRKNFLLQTAQEKGEAEAQALRSKLEQQEILMADTSDKLSKIGVPPPVANILATQQATGIDILGLVTSKRDGKSKMGHESYTKLVTDLKEDATANSPNGELTAEQIQKITLQADAIRQAYEGAPDARGFSLELGDMFSGGQGGTVPESEGALGGPAPSAADTVAAEMVQDIQANRVSLSQLKQEAVTPQQQAVVRRAEQLLQVSGPRSRSTQQGLGSASSRNQQSRSRFNPAEVSEIQSLESPTVARQYVLSRMTPTERRSFDTLSPQEQQQFIDQALSNQ